MFINIKILIYQGLAQFFLHDEDFFEVIQMVSNKLARFHLSYQCFPNDTVTSSEKKKFRC